MAQNVMSNQAGKDELEGRSTNDLGASTGAQQTGRFQNFNNLYALNAPSANMYTTNQANNVNNNETAQAYNDPTARAGLYASGRAMGRSAQQAGTRLSPEQASVASFYNGGIGSGPFGALAKKYSDLADIANKPPAAPKQPDNYNWNTYQANSTANAQRAQQSTPGSLYGLQRQTQDNQTQDNRQVHTMTELDYELRTGKITADEYYRLLAQQGQS